MAGVDTAGGGGGKKRAVDQEINMIPFIDLLMVTISFLLITAVWSSMARLSATAAVPSPHGPKPPAKTAEPSVLHVHVDEPHHAFVLQWQSGTKVEDFVTVPMDETNGRYLALEDATKKAYVVGQQTQHLHGDDVAYEDDVAGEHGAATLNSAILHFDNAFAFKDVVRVIDAIYAPRRYVCFGAKPVCCGTPDGAGKSSEGCSDAASDVPAFEVSFASN
jgi:biopolymer transport protein ExbD